MMQEHIIAKGKIFELVQTTQSDGRVFEVARRAPGVRVIIADKSGRKLLLTRELRAELGDWDYRLPGGKVFDSLDEYEAFRQSGGDIVDAAAQKAKAEAAEEAGVQIDAVTFVAKSTLGATVEWDLYVFEALDWRETTQQDLEAGERVETGHWFTFDEVTGMILDGKLQEHRIALILLQWLKGIEHE